MSNKWTEKSVHNLSKNFRKVFSTFALQFHIKFIGSDTQNHTKLVGWIFQVKVISMVIKFQMVASHAYKQWLCSNKNRYRHIQCSKLCKFHTLYWLQKKLFQKRFDQFTIRLDTNQSFIIVGNTDAVVAQLTLLLFVVTVVLSTFKFKIQGQ